MASSAACTLLPFFDPIDGADAGFDPADHTRVDTRLGTGRRVGARRRVDVMADSSSTTCRATRQSSGLRAARRASPLRGDVPHPRRVFPDGATEAELRAIYRPRPGCRSRGDAREWGAPATVDDVHAAAGRHRRHAPARPRVPRPHPERVRRARRAHVRLDAVGYAIKKPGTSCFMIPETFAFIAELSQGVRALGMEVLVEIHSHYRQQIEIARASTGSTTSRCRRSCCTRSRSAQPRPLKEWLRIRPRNALTVLDTHDGIGIIDIGAERGAGGLPGLVPPHELDALVERIHAAAAASEPARHRRGRVEPRSLPGELHVLRRARARRSPLPARARTTVLRARRAAGLLRWAARGRERRRPAQRSGVGRDINRHYYAPGEVRAALERPVVANLCALIRLRNSHPAFAGTFALGESPESELVIEWRNGAERAELRVDLRTDRYRLAVSQGGTLRELDLLALAASAPAGAGLRAAR
jgi:sucrose phosphorylase